MSRLLIRTSRQRLSSYTVQISNRSYCRATSTASMASLHSNNKPTMFTDVPLGPPDPMYDLKMASDADLSPDKIDVGIGVYRGDVGGYYQFGAVRKAKKILDEQDPGHDYNPTTGIKSFVDGATKLLFGENSTLVQEGRTVAGTGANRIGAAFLNRNFPSHSGEQRHLNKTPVFIGTPAWGNYAPLFQHAGFAIQTYIHYDRKTGIINFPGALQAVTNAPERSIFVFQACCHNPTGQDFDRQQWQQIAEAVKDKQHFVFFDIAYQGFASGMEEDGWCVRYFADMGIDLLACQSFSKHMGLYSERLGVLHVVCKSQSIATRVSDQLRSLIRWEVSSTPAYGARLAAIILSDKDLYAQWTQEVASARQRLEKMRSRLYQLLRSQYNTPGDWGHIVQEKGLFSLLSLSESQIEKLKTLHHIHLPSNGRINVAGLNKKNIERFARAVDEVIHGDVATRNKDTNQTRENYQSEIKTAVVVEAKL